MTLDSTVTVSSIMVMTPPVPPVMLPGMGPAFNIDNINGTISGSGMVITTSMQVQAFLSYLLKGHTAQTLKVFSAGESTAGGNTPKSLTATLTINDVLEVTAENGDLKQYTITVIPN
ncbi:hypothetical protein MHB40_13265 [Lysinibacillus sp. FSL K6-0057]|uniref:hypothetical protein n=1 Tax=unclassified Lysinibacillus TaxID=2636778 RepID=UPI003159409F